MEYGSIFTGCKRYDVKGLIFENVDSKNDKNGPFFEQFMVTPNTIFLPQELFQIVP